MEPTGRSARVFLRDAGVATAVLVVFVALTLTVPLSVVQLPGYLLFLLYLSVSEPLGVSGSLNVALFAAFLVMLGVVGAGIARFFRRSAARAEKPSWRLGSAGALILVGGLTMLGALLTIASVGLGEPGLVLVVAITGIGLLALAAALVKG